MLFVCNGHDDGDSGNNLRYLFIYLRSSRNVRCWLYLHNILQVIWMYYVIINIQYEANENESEVVFRGHLDSKAETG